MAAMHMYAYIFLTVTFFREGFGVTDEEFLVGSFNLELIVIQFKLFGI